MEESRTWLGAEFKGKTVPAKPLANENWLGVNDMGVWRKAAQGYRRGERYESEGGRRSPFVELGERDLSLKGDIALSYYLLKL